MTNRTKKILIIALVVVAVFALLVIGLLAGAAMMGWRSAVRAGNEAATIQNLKTISVVEVQYFNTHRRTFGTLDQLVSEQMLSAKFAGNPTVADGYVYTLSVGRTPDGVSSYKVTADPENESQGTHHFYLDSNAGGIHVNSNRQAGPDDPVE